MFSRIVTATIVGFSLFVAGLVFGFAERDVSAAPKPKILSTQMLLTEPRNSAYCTAVNIDQTPIVMDIEVVSDQGKVLASMLNEFVFPNSGSWLEYIGSTATGDILFCKVTVITGKIDNVRAGLEIWDQLTEQPTMAVPAT